ncbi:MAG TPA: P-loop NTPase [Clostridia bacterium]|nr:P-loop NTPase [Clostridia bacterium]
MFETQFIPTRQVPANFGPLKGANAHAQILGPCGDTMEFWLRLESDHILQATFTTDGCGASIRSGSAAAKLATGKTLQEACNLTALQIEQAVGELPPDHKHCPVLALNTLKAAAENYRQHNGGQSLAAAKTSQAPPPAKQSTSARATEKAVRQPGDEESLKRAVSRIGCKLLVLSGKGGVGKSTVAVNLAMALAAAGRKVGLLDIDIHGPSIPKMMGLENSQPPVGSGALHPIAAGPNLKVMSMGFLLRSAADAIVWRGPIKASMIRQFLSEIDWGDLDVLVVDCPPGTGDEPLSIAQMLGPDTAAIVVTTPQAVAIADVRRSVTFCQKLQLRVLGIIENMGGFACPHCGKHTDLFGNGGGEALAQEMNAPFLGRIPLEPEIVVSGDAGTPFIEHFAQSQSARVLNDILRSILPSLDPKSHCSAKS